MIEWEPYDESAYEFELDAQGSNEWGSAEYIEIIAGGAAEYDGPYQVTPTWSMQEFATNGLLMTDDFTVNSMLELEVPNDAGGLTLTI